jgi:hypothetical protein
MGMSSHKPRIREQSPLSCLGRRDLRPRSPDVLVPEQLSGGIYQRLSDADWKLILPYLKENRLFGIQVERDLLTVDSMQEPAVYRNGWPRRRKSK